MYFCAVNYFRQILVFLLAVFYLFLSTGVVLFQTHCACSDSTSISMYTEPEVCIDNVVAVGSCCSQTESGDNTDDIQTCKSCNCDTPTITYLKLTDHSGADSGLEYPFAQQLFLVNFPEAVLCQIIDTSNSPKVFPDYSPPQNYPHGRFLLNFINQRKIDLLA